MTDPELRFPNRVAKLREKLAAEELDAIFISNGENRRYLSGFVSTAGYLLITQTDAVVLTDFRYTEQAGTQAPGFHVERIGGPLDWLPRAVDSVGIGRFACWKIPCTAVAYAKSAISSTPAPSATSGMKGAKFEIARSTG